MAAAVEVANGEDIYETAKSEEHPRTASSISCIEKAASSSEIQSSESVAIKKKKFYTKKPRTAEFIQTLHTKWLRQWISGNGLNPIMLINQIMPSAEYSLLCSDNVSNKWHFVIQLKFNDQIYQGEGSSKKKAKSEAAEKAVTALAAAFLGSLAERVAADDALSAPVDGPAPDPCSSNPMPSTEAAQVPDSEGETKQNGLSCEAPQAASDVASTSKSQADELTSRIATRILNEVRPGTKYEVVSAKAKQVSNMYTVAVTLEGQRFEATGPSKQKAKAAVAEQVLTGLFNLKFNKLTDGTPVFAGDDEDWMSLRVGELDSKLLQGLDFLGTKSPLMWLNELYPSASFEFRNVASVVVDPHTLYEVSVSVELQTYEGRGRSKKQAKLAAAVAALRDLNATGMFAQRIADKERLKKHRNQPWHNEGHAHRAFPPYFHRQPFYLANGLSRNVTIKDPVTWLNEIHPEFSYEFIESDSDNFAVSVMVQGRRQVGSGRSKLQAMNNVAEKVLHDLDLWTAYNEQVKRERLRPADRSGAGRSSTDFQPDLDVLMSMMSNFGPLGDGRHQGSARAYGYQSSGGSSGVFSRCGDPNLPVMQRESSLGGNRNRGSGPHSRGYRGQFRRYNVQRFGSGGRGAFMQGMLQSNQVVNHVASSAGPGAVIPGAIGVDGVTGYHF